MRAASAYAEPKPTPAPNATADHLFVGLLNIRSPDANPDIDPYTNRRTVKSKTKSYCSSSSVCDIRRGLAGPALLFGPSALSYKNKKPVILLQLCHEQLNAKHDIKSSKWVKSSSLRP